MEKQSALKHVYLSWKVGDSFDVYVVDVENSRIVGKIDCNCYIGNTWTKFDWIRDLEEKPGVAI